MAELPINSFNAGELSPYLYARSDLDKYRSGCLVMENFVPLPYGGATRRPAWGWLGEAKDSDADGDDDRIRLLPFIASVDAAYQLELGTGYMRFWKNGAQLESASVPVEVGTPYAESDLLNIKTAQSVDVMWFVDGSNQVHRLSRFSDTNWTFEPENFDYPPLLEENITDITMSPSDTTGTITLTASRDFFDEGHVGTYMKFDVLRLLDNQTVKGAVSATTISDELYVSNANWSFSTTGTGTGKWTIERSLDGGAVWRDYVVAGDSRGYATAKLFAVESDSPEPLNARIRVRYVYGSGTTSYSLVCESALWESMVQITGYISATEATAEVIAEFQDLSSEYSEWETGYGYVIGNKVTVPDEVVYAGTPVNGTDYFDLKTVDSSLDDLTGMDYGGGYFWFVSNTVGNKKIHKVSWDGTYGTPISSHWTLEASYDVTGQINNVHDIAYYSGEVYVVGYDTVLSQAKVVKYSTAGVYISTPLTRSGTDVYRGLGYHNGYFYIGSDSPLYNIEKYTTTFLSVGVSHVTGSDGKQDDIAGIGSKLYVVNDNQNTLDTYTEGLVYRGAYDISDASTAPKGSIYDGEHLWIIDASGVLYRLSVTTDAAAYECTYDHISGTFSNDYNSGYWIDKTPEMTTWTEGAFSDYRGHPKSVVLHEGRVVYGGTGWDPNTMWLSVDDDFANFRTGSLDTDGLKLQMASGQYNIIEWMVSQEVLVIGTAGAEWALGPSDELKKITPTGYNLKRKSTYGTSEVQGLLVNNAVVFPMRQGRKIREWIYQYDLKDPAIDLAILSEHITDPSIESMALQQQPDNIVWAVRSDGVLIALTYERDQNVVGWHRHPSDDYIVESVSVIPRADEEDEVWASIKITIDGDIKRYICRMNDREWGTNYVTQWQGSDLWVNYQSAGDASHLIGKTVDIVVDGVVKAQEVVDGTGSISATLGTNNIVGLPFDSTLAPLYLSFTHQYGTSKGKKIAVRKAVLKFKDTFSAKVGSSLSHLESVKYNPDGSALYNGDEYVSFGNESDYLQTCYVRQDSPMPCTVLAMFPDMEVRG